MSSLQPDSVAIHRLHIRAAARSTTAGLERISRQLRRELDLAAWPEAPGQSWVFIRQVQAQGPAYRLADQLVQATRVQVEGGDSDNLVRFASLADLLAALLADLVRGRAAGRWYWRRWLHLFQLPEAAAVQQLLTEHLSQLSSVCARLAQQQALTEVWLTLDEAGAGQLLLELAGRSGFELPETHQLEMERLHPGTDLPMLTLLPGSSLWRHWAPVLRALPVTDNRFQLALCLIGQQLVPLLLKQDPAALLVQLTDIFETLRTSAAQPRPLPSTRVRDGIPPVSAALPARVISPSANSASRNSNGRQTETQVQKSSDTGALALPLQPDQRTPSASPSTPASSQPMRTQRTDPKIQPLRPSDDASSISSNDSSTPDAGPGNISKLSDSPRQALRFAPADPDFSQFTSTQGGLLYLLNFLNRPQTQALLENYWEQLPSGWGWLYRLGQTLQLDENDPIVAFIATQLGLDQPNEIDQIPPLPAPGKLLDLAHRWYGGAELWQPELLQLNARIQFSPSHLDLYAPLAAVRLPVRLAGLDIDPGWLPWLGRVVSFHYE